MFEGVDVASAFQDSMCTSLCFPSSLISVQSFISRFRLVSEGVQETVFASAFRSAGVNVPDFYFL